MANVSIDKERENYLNKTLEEKRNLYRCGNNFTTVSNIPTWKEYFTAHRHRLPQVSDSFKSAELEGKQLSSNPSLVDKVSMWVGDITTLEIDAIVNAANKTLMGGGGVDGAIHRAAGGLLKKECSTLGGCDTGDAKISCGYNLPAKYVIHTVGPVGEYPEKLRSCYKRCLELVKKDNLRSVAFPCISTGVYGYPQDRAATVAIQTVRQFLVDHSDDVDRVIFCLFLKEDVAIYEKLLQVYFPVQET